MARCSAHPTQPAVVIRSSEACSEVIAGQDAYDAVLTRARCEHPEMLVDPHGYRVRRVPSQPNVARFVIERAEAHETVDRYEVDGAGAVRRAP